MIFVQSYVFWVLCFITLFLQTLVGRSQIYFTLVSFQTWHRLSYVRFQVRLVHYEILITFIFTVVLMRLSLSTRSFIWDPISSSYIFILWMKTSFLFTCYNVCLMLYFEIIYLSVIYVFIWFLKKIYFFFIVSQSAFVYDLFGTSSSIYTSVYEEQNRYQNMTY